MVPPLLLLILLSSLVDASLPLVDFDRMGKVGLAGAFAGLDLFQNATEPFDPTTSSLFARASNGSLDRLASSNSGGRISAGCALSDVFYLAGSFSSIDGTPATNIASYTPSSDTFAALGSNGPNGEIDAVYCDTKNNKLWVGGIFTSPGTSVAVWDPKAASWSAPPFKGFVGAEGRVLSITTNSSDSSLFFAGSFITSFVGNGSVVLNGTNNPNVPFSAGATPFSSSLVPVPIPASDITGSPSSTESGFTNASDILCPTGADGAGNTWFGANTNTAELTIRTFTFMTVSGVRLGNTFQPNHGTTGFTLTTIPDNTVQTLTFVDPTTNQNTTCSNPCPLGTDSSILYQDFLFSGPLSITGVLIQLTEFTGDGPGLHILQLLSAGAFASAVSSQNGPSCFAPIPSNTSFTGNWVEKDAQTGIAGTEVTVLTSTVAVGTSANDGPTFTWNPYVSASGEYTMNMLVPGCTQLQDCPLRTSVQVTVFPGNNLQPFVTNVTQQNTADATVEIYKGPILPTSPDFLTTITMTLAEDPVGAGQDGNWELVADRIELVLDSVNTTSGSANSSSTGTGSTRDGFGFFEWPITSTATIDGTATLANSTETALDTVGFSMFTAVGGNSSLASSSTTAIVAVVHHPSAIIFLGGNFMLSSGSASSSGNVVSFKDGALVTLTANGLNGPVTSLVLDGDTLFVGGSFTDTKSASNSLLRGVAAYNVQANQWTALAGGVNGVVTSMSFIDGQLQVAGNFTSLLTSTGAAGSEAAGFAVWDVASSEWVNSGGFVVGSMTLVTNGTSAIPQFVAGNVTASQAFGASGMVMLQNSGSDVPTVSPLGVALEADVSSGAGQNSTTASRKRSHPLPRAAAWLSRVKFPVLFGRQTSTALAALPAALPAPAPAVLAGAFWTNSSSSVEITVIGGNFSFFPSGSESTEAQSVALYDANTATSTALQGAQVNGTVRALLVVGDILYVGGEFTITGMNANGFAIYDLSTQQWDTSTIQALQGSSGAAVVVRSITASTSQPNTIIVAGSFSQAGSLRCQAVCSLDTSSKQWNALGSGIQGELASVDYAGDNEQYLIAAGSIALSDNTPANVAQFTFSNTSWVSVGSGSDLPGPVTAVAVNAGNGSSIFAAGRSTDASSSFLSFWDGVSWSALSSTLESNTTVAQLAMVPLQDTHTANSIIQSDRMLMISGSLADSSFGNASTALFDGQSFFPYIVSTSSTGSSGTVSSMFHSFATFSFTQNHFLATGVVILISIAIAAGVVFLLALIGILWTLFSRRDDKLNKFDGADEDDDDSTHHRPSSLLEHINAATRTTIIGTPFAAFNAKEDKLDARSPTPDHDPDPFAPDASNYMRAETPSDAIGGVMTEEMSRPAQARYSFDGTGDGELPISAGSAVEVLDDRDPAWWYARDVKTGREGVVPAAYLF